MEDQVGSDILSFLNTISDAAPTITTSQLPNGTVGRTYQETLTSSGTTPITWTIENGELPDNLSLNKTTGQISGIPKTADSFTFTVKAQNSVGANTKELTIKIDPAPVKPQITTTSLPSGVVGITYGENISFTGTEPITWSVISGKLPDNLALVNGRISGRPNKVDTYTFTIQASNRAGNDTKTFTIKIYDSTNNDDNNNENDDNNNDNDSNNISDERANKLRNLPVFKNIGNNTPVQRLSRENATINSYRQNNEKYDDEKIITTLPEILVYSSGIYLINVSFDEYVSRGTTLIWHAGSTNITVGEIYPSASDGEQYAFLDDNDNEILMPIQTQLAHVNVATYLEAYKTYKPVITAQINNNDEIEENNDEHKNDENNDSNNDKPDYNNYTDDTNNNTGINTSSGGCNSSFPSILLLIISIYFISKRKHTAEKNK